jgi:hypothetical protein
LGWKADPCTVTVPQMPAALRAWPQPSAGAGISWLLETHRTRRDRLCFLISVIASLEGPKGKHCLASGYATGASASKRHAGYHIYFSIDRKLLPAETIVVYRPWVLLHAMGILRLGTSREDHTVKEHTRGSIASSQATGKRKREMFLVGVIESQTISKSPQNADIGMSSLRRESRGKLWQSIA